MSRPVGQKRAGNRAANTSPACILSNDRVFAGFFLTPSSVKRWHF